MQAAEFEGFTRNHSVPVPEGIPDGTHIKIKEAALHLQLNALRYGWR